MFVPFLNFEKCICACLCACVCEFWGRACLCVYVLVCAWSVEMRQNYNDHDSSAIISFAKTTHRHTQKKKRDDFECGSGARVEKVTER